MHAQVGDRLIVGGDTERTALIIAVPHADASPPYVVKWLATGHIAMVSPGQFGRIIRVGHGTLAAAHLSDSDGPPASSDAAWSGTDVCDSRGRERRQWRSFGNLGPEDRD